MSLYVLIKIQDHLANADQMIHLVLWVIVPLLISNTYKLTIYIQRFIYSIVYFLKLALRISRGVWLTVKTKQINLLWIIFVLITTKMQLKMHFVRIIHIHIIIGPVAILTWLSPGMSPEHIPVVPFHTKILRTFFSTTGTVASICNE